MIQCGDEMKTGETEEKEIYLSKLLWNKIQRNTVDTVTKASRLRSIVEDVTEMSVALKTKRSDDRGDGRNSIYFGTMNFRSRINQCVIGFRCEIRRDVRREETWPTGSTVEFLFGTEDRRVTHDTVVDASLFVRIQWTGERWFGAMILRHISRHRGQMVQIHLFAARLIGVGRCRSENVGEEFQHRSRFISQGEMCSVMFSITSPRYVVVVFRIFLRFSTQLVARLELETPPSGSAFILVLIARSNRPIECAEKFVCFSVSTCRSHRI